MRNKSQSCTPKKMFVVMALRKIITLCERSLQVTTIFLRTTPHFWQFEAKRVLRVSTVYNYSQLIAPLLDFSTTFETKEIGCFLPIALQKLKETFSFLFHKRHSFFTVSNAEKNLQRADFLFSRECLQNMGTCPRAK